MNVGGAGPANRKARARASISLALAAALALIASALPASAQPAKPYNLGGVWEGTSGPSRWQVNLVHSGSSVTARYAHAHVGGVSEGGTQIAYAQGEVDTTGTLSSGGIIDGTTAIFLFEDDARTRIIGKGSAPIVLSVSDDGLRLVGTWFDDVTLNDVPISYTKKPSIALETFRFDDDLDSGTMKYLSTGSHTYFGGMTRIHGRIRVQRIGGTSSLRLTSMKLEVVQSGIVRASAGLVSSAQDVYLNRAFSSGFLGTQGELLLFELASSETGQINTSSSVRLRIKITTNSGEEFVQQYGTAITPLVRYTGANRYGPRDTDKGGDDWVRPSVKTALDHYRTTYGSAGIKPTKGSAVLLFGDMSNMNGETFPGHAGHENGAEVDGWFTGYNDRNALVAQVMVGLLNDVTYGSRITKVLVTYSERVPCDAFCTAIKDVTLRDGRRARDVIRPASGHGTHFHWYIAP